MADIIERWRSGIKQVADLFENINELGQDFNEKLDDQGEKLGNVVDNLEVANENTQKGV